ncbi:hypothetical protein FRC08_005933 [Ceratobasidium sp. 394]|nr:hypothetical protein FRC08_005933 [Ceratobasidium sp. 394]
MSTQQRLNLFLHISTSPNPDANHALWEHHLRQRRPISQNPFEPKHSPSRDNFGLAKSNSSLTTLAPRPSPQHEEGRLGYNVARENIGHGGAIASKKNSDRDWGDQIPSWLNLLYDLAWTATFSSLTSNTKFKGLWDIASYAVFFATAWWLWVTQVFYNAEFYTDDWFHVLFILLQLGIFGALALATRGFDVTNYILHSPGSDHLEPYDINTITPDRYRAESFTGISAEVIMVSISISRALLFTQHLRVAIYAKITSRTKGYPLKLFIVPASLVVSATLFFVAFEITSSSYGRTPQGARIKYVLWGIAILVEVVAHIVRSRMDIGEGDGIRLRSHGSITERLTNITTIILGECINAIAGTFYAIEKEPAPDGPIGAAIICCIAIEFFLVYLYFNSTAPLKSVRRRAAWVMMHLPWLLTVILLLEGVKNQLLLQSFMASSVYMQTKMATNTRKNVPMGQFNATMKPILLQGGMSYEKEFGDLVHMIRNQSVSSNPKVASPTHTGLINNETMGVWYLRLQLKGILNTYNTFMDNDSIPDPTQNTIQQYLFNYNYTLEDYHSTLETGGDTPHLFQIMNGLTGPNFNNIHYIMAMCGGTFITLASLNLIQSWPRDRFCWASIFSRYAMGIIMILLLLLNLGKSQAYFGTPTSQRAGTLRWLDADMVLPTLALAYAVQFIIDTVLAYLAVRSSRKLPGHSSSDQLELGLPAIASSSLQPAAPVPVPVPVQAQAQAPAPIPAPASASVAALVQAALIPAQAPVPTAYTSENSLNKAELGVMDERDVKASNTSEHIRKENIAEHNPGATVYNYSQPPAGPDQYGRPGDCATVYDWDQGLHDQGVGVLQPTQNPVAYTHQQQQAQRRPQLQPQYNYSYNEEPKSPDQQPQPEQALQPQQHQPGCVQPPESRHGYGQPHGPQQEYAEPHDLQTHHETTMRDKV